MRYYSDTLKRFFDTEKECLTAENEHEQKILVEKLKKEKLKEEKNKRLKELEKAYEKSIESKEKYYELYHAFIKDYEESPWVKENSSTWFNRLIESLY